MATYEITADLQAQLDDINQKLEQAFAEGAHLLSTKIEADTFWDHLRKCEQYLITGTLYSREYSHDMENILALYHLNHLVDEGHVSHLLREVFNMPLSGVTQQLIDERINWAGWVAGDGTIYAASRFCQLDFRWFLVLVYYYYYKVRPEKKHHFVPKASQGSNVKIPKNAKIAIIGDWGTGSWQDGEKNKCPAQLVIEGVLQLKPDYIVHLGDVYYAGTGKEEKKHLLDLLPESYSHKVFTMNSNHEMYDGANGLMGITLRDPKFAQQGCSTCFSLEIGDWILLGLDSAYYDDSVLYMKGSLYNSEGGQEQLGYLSDAQKTGKKIFLMTHHNGIEVAEGGPTPNKGLWNQVVGTLENLPDAWYWGHVHNGIVYADDLPFYRNQQNENATSKMRCCGHASIPFGRAKESYLGNFSTGPDSMVSYYAHTQMPEPTDEVQKLRVINGFAVININGASMTETFYEVSNENPIPTPVWPKR